jgi:hypothetical protein
MVVPGSISRSPENGRYMRLLMLPSISPSAPHLDLHRRVAAPSLGNLEKCETPDARGIEKFVEEISAIYSR